MFCFVFFDESWPFVASSAVSVHRHSGRWRACSAVVVLVARMRLEVQTRRNRCRVGQARVEGQDRGRARRGDDS